MENLKNIQISVAQLKAVLLFIATFSACGPSKSDLISIDYSPLKRADWKVSTPSEQGLDSMLLAELYYNAAGLETLYSLLVIKNGFLIAEDYFNDGSVDQKDRLQSVTKSFTSALVGIAIQEGCLSSIDQKLVDFFPEIKEKITDPRKYEITIRELLEMQAGYPREEDDQAYWDGLLSGYYTTLIEDFPLVSEPGTKFHYSNLSSNWLGIIVDRSCGMNLKAYAEKKLFGPLDIESGDWGTDAEGHNNGSGDLHLSARDAAKFGQLFLNDGLLEGKQLIPEDWVDVSLQTYSVNEAFVNRIGDFRDIGYGFQWWSANTKDYHVNFAWGHGGQLIVLVDELDMVIVTTSYPFWLEHNSQSWKQEKAIITMVSKFVSSIPNPNKS
ncbi:serine hydrolase domain-containing protein [Algoriphagus sediminis]|uniref:Serine hydrolase n=1 Tax=Algoriphagus sediminis TaxID=3057113 RepID=A0ABT7Y911_9BACT|nr:serine hydrolase [Algoriphagus sediminis]MDN3202978.1 serine hydrolase [Algoriphagus sediminis]